MQQSIEQPFCAEQLKGLSDEQIEALQAVADYLTGTCVPELGCLTDEELNAEFNILKPCEGCVPEDEEGEDILEAINKKFRAVFDVAVDLAEQDLKKLGLEPANTFAFCPMIEPSYDDATHIVILDYRDSICYLHEWHKAWQFHFKSLQELADAVLKVKRLLVQQVKLRHGENNKPPIYVIVQGGLVQDVTNVPAQVQVVVIDYDTQGADPEDVQPSPTDGQPCCLSTY